MTYQRNKSSLSSGSGLGGLEDLLDDGVPDRVQEPEIGAGDDHEPEHDRRALADLAAVGPLDAAQLGPGGAEEVGRAAAQALAGPPGVMLGLVPALLAILAADRDPRLGAGLGA